MAIDDLISWSDEAGLRLERDGLGFCKQLVPDLSTLDVVRHLGTVIEIDKMLPSSGIPAVQLLIPKAPEEARNNRYSGNYGLDAFPLHTDLAHWAVPPRYFLLRCLAGSSNVVTKLLPANYIIHRLGNALLQKAILRVRKHRLGSSGVLRALCRIREHDVFRWDSIFLEPVNEHAMTLKRMMEGCVFDEIMGFCLQDRGDTLLIDNWRLLHGRSAVPLGSTRQIERVYFSRLNV